MEYIWNIGEFTKIVLKTSCKQIKNSQLSMHSCDHMSALRRSFQMTFWSRKRYLSIPLLLESTLLVCFYVGSVKIVLWNFLPKRIISNPKIIRLNKSSVNENLLKHFCSVKFDVYLLLAIVPNSIFKRNSKILKKLVLFWSNNFHQTLI